MFLVVGKNGNVLEFYFEDKEGQIYLDLKWDFDTNKWNFYHKMSRWDDSCIDQRMNENVIVGQKFHILLPYEVVCIPDILDRIEFPDDDDVKRSVKRIKMYLDAKVIGIPLEIE